MNDKYKDYSDEYIKYYYPITWNKRNKDYLLKREDRLFEEKRKKKKEGR